MTPSVHPSRPAPAERRRGPVRRFLEARGTIGGHRAPHEDLVLGTEDGVRLAASYLPGPTLRRDPGPAVLLLHGFAANRRKPAYAYLADGLAQHRAVLSLDLRGHGASAGSSTLGDREVLDAAAGLAWLRRRGHTHVTVVGLSMGGTTALHASATGLDADAVVAVSAPARFREDPETPGMQKLAQIWRSPWKRHGMRAVIGVRVVAPSRWLAPPHPEELVTRTTLPLLVVHGADDLYFPPTDAEALVRAAAGPATLWLEPAGFGHAEDGVTSAFVADLSGAIAVVEERGRFPDRRELAGAVAGRSR